MTNPKAQNSSLGLVNHISSDNLYDKQPIIRLSY